MKIKVPHVLSTITALLVMMPAAAQQPQNAPSENPAQVTLSVESVEVGAADLAKANRFIAKGPEHDTKLLAVLHKTAGSFTQGPSVQTVNDIAAEMTISRQDSISQNVKNEKKTATATLVESTKFTPHINGDHTITVDLKLRRSEFLNDARQSPITINDISTVTTFRPGEIEMIPYAAIKGSDTKKCLAFIKVATPSLQ